MSIARKMFIGRVAVPPLIASSLYALMRDSALHWGFETTGLTTPSLDSIIGSEVSVVPDGVVFIGTDSATMPASGVSLAAATNFSLQDFGADFGVIDPTQIFFYPSSQSGTGMAVVFTAR